MAVVLVVVAGGLALRFSVLVALLVAWLGLGAAIVAGRWGRRGGQG